MVNYAYKLNGFGTYWTSSVGAPPYIGYVSSSGVIGSYREGMPPYWNQAILAMRPAILFDI